MSVAREEPVCCLDWRGVSTETGSALIWLARHAITAGYRRGLWRAGHAPGCGVDSSLPYGALRLHPMVIVQKGNEGLYNPDPEQLSRNAAVSNVGWWGWMTGPSRPGAVGDCASGDYTVFNQNETSVGKTI